MTKGWVVWAVPVLAAGMVSYRGHPRESGRGINPAITFQRRCSGCHGVRGQGGTGADLRRLSDPTPAIAAIIADGQGKMPPFRRRLTPRQIRSLAVYVKGLR